MKFSSIALAAISLLFDYELVEGRTTLTHKELNQRLQSGQFNHEMLLKNAVRFRQKEMKRKLDEDDDAGDDAAEDDADDDEEEEAEEEGQRYYDITGQYSAKFNSCVTLTVENDDMYEMLEDEEMAQYFYKGQISPQRSYVLFNLCKTREDCVYAEDSTSNTYMVDLKTYIESLIYYLPTRKEQYCEGCEEQEDFCTEYYGDEDEDEDEEYQNVQEGQKRYQTNNVYFYNDVKYEIIDCSLCKDLKCNENEDAYEENDWEGVSEWMVELAGCYDTGSQWNGADMYASFMCNSDGTGVEIGVFDDEDCTLYNSQKNYGKLIENGSEEWQYYYKSTDIMGYLVKNSFDCYGGATQYLNWYELYQNADEYGDPCMQDAYGNYVDYDQCQEERAENPCYAEDGYEVDQDECDEYEMQNAAEASEVCYNLFADNDGFTAVSLENCEDVQDDEVEEEEDEDENGDGENNNKYYQNQYGYNQQFDFDVTSEYANSGSTMCNAVRTKYNGGSIDNVYDEGSSGSLFSNIGNGNWFPSVDVMNTLNNPKKVSPAALAGLALLSAAITFVGLYVYFNRRDAEYEKKLKDAAFDSDTKIAPLV